MKARAIVGAAAVTAAVMAAAPAFAGWSAAGVGKAAVKAGSVSAPTNVHITACTATNKSSNNVTGTVTVTWTVSASSIVSGQKLFRGDTASPVVYAGSAVATIGNNTTASATVNYTSLAAGAYTIGVQGTTASVWASPTAGSNNTFNPSTAGGSNGSCTVV